MPSPKNPSWLAPVFFFLLLFCSPSSVSASAVVTHLPGFQGPLPFHLETGYVNVDEEKGVELFYYFTRSERNPSEDPFLIWLSGGPGCSALTGVLFEIGPFEIIVAKYNGSLPSLKYRPLTWTKFANIIFLDYPGAGFSYSNDGDATGDLSTSYHVYSFIIKLPTLSRDMYATYEDLIMQWFKDHPQFILNPLYISGDSYAGKFIPIITQLVAQGIEVGEEPLFNLKGYIMGNPITGEKVDKNSRVPFAHRMGIISDELAQSIQRSCQGQDHANPQTVECTKNLRIFATFYNEINSEHILEPKCPYALHSQTTISGISSDRTRSLKEHIQLLDPPSLFSDFKCRDNSRYLSYYWVNNKATKEALHVRNGTVKEWVRCDRDIVYDEDVPSNLEYQINLTSKGYRALIYSGDHDFIFPFTGTNEWIKSLSFLVVDGWRSWHVGGQVAGYTVFYSNNLTFATVKGAGHMSPEYKTEECFNMFGRWISYQPL